MCFPISQKQLLISEKIIEILFGLA